MPKRIQELFLYHCHRYFSITGIIFIWRTRNITTFLWRPLSTTKSSPIYCYWRLTLYNQSIAQSICKKLRAETNFNLIFEYVLWFLQTVPGLTGLCCRYSFIFYYTAFISIHIDCIRILSKCARMSSCGQISCRRSRKSRILSVWKYHESIVHTTT